MTEALKDLGDYIAAAMPNKIVGTEVDGGELVVRTTSGALTEVMAFLHRESACQFKVLIDITAIDYPEREARFDVVYILLSMTRNQRLRVMLSIDAAAQVPSVSEIYRAAVWYEREAWDMFGVQFSGNPDLRRILTDYGFEGHPLRKDFPLSGHTELHYDEAQKRVVYGPVNLPQEFRTFDFVSPWESMAHILAGDEKASIGEEDGAPRDNNGDSDAVARDG